MLLKEHLILSVQGVLQRILSGGIGLPQIVVPVTLVPEVLRLAHDDSLSGHQGPKQRNTLESFTPILVANT